MMNGVLARLMQAMQGQAHTAGMYDDDGPQMPGDAALEGAFQGGGMPQDMSAQGPMGAGPAMQDVGQGQDYGPDASLMADPSMQVDQGGGQDFPLAQEQGDLWAPQQQMGPQQPQSLQAMFASSPAMGGRMSTK